MARKISRVGTLGGHSNKHLTQPQYDRMRRMRRDGMTLIAIADEFGVSESLVSRVCAGKVGGPLEAR